MKTPVVEKGCYLQTDDSIVWDGVNNKVLTICGNIVSLKLISSWTSETQLLLRGLFRKIKKNCSSGATLFLITFEKMSSKVVAYMSEWSAKLLLRTLQLFCSFLFSFFFLMTYNAPETNMSRELFCNSNVLLTALSDVLKSSGKKILRSSCVSLANKSSSVYSYFSLARNCFSLTSFAQYIMIFFYLFTRRARSNI